MIELVYSPTWFYGKDIVIDVISIFVLSLIGFFSLQYYFMKKRKKSYFSLAISFFTLAAAFLWKILMNFTIYYRAVETRQLGFVVFTYTTLKSTNTLFFVGFLLYRLLTLFGLYLLYSVYQKQSRANIVIVSFLIIISTYFSQSAYYIFYLTSLLFLVMITQQYWKNFKKNRLGSSKMLMQSFGIIALSQVFFTFVKINKIWYVWAELVQLLGYILLLITFIMVLKHGKKKGQNRHHA